MSTASGPRGPFVRQGQAAPARKGSWGAIAVVGVLLLPVVEIVALVATGQAIGIWWTLALLALMSLVGAWLMRREGLATLRSLRRTAEEGRVPGREAVDAALVVAGGLLLLLPGFVTDLLGLLLILPVTRPIARTLLIRRLESRVMHRTGVVQSVLVEERREPTVREIPHIDLRRDH